MNTFPRINQHASTQVPYDVVEEIFLRCLTPLEWCGDPKDPNQHPPSTNVPILLSHVSKTWREIVHGMPALWTSVCMHNPTSRPEILQQILHYSKNRPLTVCIVMGGQDIDYSSDNGCIDLCTKELFCHSDRIRSFRMLTGYWARLWGKSVLVPPFPRLEEIKLGISLRTLYPERLAPLLNSPRLQKVTWLCEQLPEPLLQIGTQIKRLTFPDLACYSAQDTTALLQACPNLTYLDVRHKGPLRLPPDSSVDLRDLHTFRSGEIGLHLCIAPNLRHLTLTINVQNYGMIRLPQFLSLSPRIEYLHLDLSGYRTPDDLIFQFVPLTPNLVALEFTFRTVPDILTLNEMFEMFSHTGASTPTLPKLQHLTLNVLHPDDECIPPLRYDPDVLLHMLESRCNHAQTFPDGAPTVAVLRSCTMSHEDYRGNLIHQSALSRGMDVKQRLEVLQEQGLVLGGNTFTSILNYHSLLSP